VSLVEKRFLKREERETHSGSQFQKNEENGPAGSGAEKRHPGWGGGGKGNGKKGTSRGKLKKRTKGKCWKNLVACFVRPIFFLAKGKQISPTTKTGEQKVCPLKNIRRKNPPTEKTRQAGMGGRWGNRE